MCVPHSAQNSRVTARSRSLRVNCFGVPMAVAKPSGGISMNMFARAAADVLALAAVALRLQGRLAFGEIAQPAAIASAFEFHDVAGSQSFGGTNM